MSVDFELLERLKTAFGLRGLRMPHFSQAFEYWDDRDNPFFVSRGVWKHATKTKFTLSFRSGITPHLFRICSCDKVACKAGDYGEGIAWVKFTTYHNPNGRVDMWHLMIEPRGLAEWFTDKPQYTPSQRRAMFKKYSKIIISVLAQQGLMNHTNARGHVSVVRRNKDGILQELKLRELEPENLKK